MQVLTKPPRKTAHRCAFPNLRMRPSRNPPLSEDRRHPPHQRPVPGILGLSKCRLEPPRKNCITSSGTCPRVQVSFPASVNSLFTLRLISPRRVFRIRGYLSPASLSGLGLAPVKRCCMSTSSHSREQSSRLEKFRPHRRNCSDWKTLSRYLESAYRLLGKLKLKAESPWQGESSLGPYPQNRLKPMRPSHKSRLPC